MENYEIFSDSSCDIPEALQKKLQLTIVPFSVSFDKTNYQKEGEDLSAEEFYLRMEQVKTLPKTSLPSIQDYMDKFTPCLAHGKDILCFCLSSKFSGSYQSALNAANLLKEEFPNRKVVVIDSIQATGGQGLIVQEACLMRQAGFTLSETAEKIHTLKQTARIFFTVESLEHLQIGGRIGKVDALAGSLLNIKPIIVMKEGELLPVNKVRGRKKAMQAIVDMALEEIGEKRKQYRIQLVTVDRLEDAALITEKLAKHDMTVDSPFWKIGVTIGAHIGPTAIGICCIRKFDN